MIKIFEMCAKLIISLSLPLSLHLAFSQVDLVCVYFSSFLFLSFLLNEINTIVDFLYLFKHRKLAYFTHSYAKSGHVHFRLARVYNLMIAFLIPRC